MGAKPKSKATVPSETHAPIPPPGDAPAPPPLKLSVHFPAIQIPQSDGSVVVKAGRPVILRSDDEIGTAEAARILGRSQRRVQALCDEGILREGTDWRRIGARGNLIIKRASVFRLREEFQ